MKTALLLIDIQNDYFQNGKMELAGSLEASFRAQEALAYFRKQQWPIVFIQHISSRPGATFFLPDTEGAEIHTNIQPLAGEAIIQKHFPNSFRETGLLEHLQALGIEKLVVCGMMTHMCVDATVRAAFDFGFDCTVLHDACATRTLNFGGNDIPAAYVHASFLAALGGAYAEIKSVEELFY